MSPNPLKKCCAEFVSLSRGMALVLVLGMLFYWIGYKVDTATFLSRCEEKTPGDTVTVTVFRRDKLLTLPLTVGEKPQDTAWLARVESPTETQKAAYQSWLGVAWDEAEKPEKSEKSESKP